METNGKSAAMSARAAADNRACAAQITLPCSHHRLFSKRTACRIPVNSKPYCMNSESHIDRFMKKTRMPKPSAPSRRDTIGKISSGNKTINRRELPMAINSRRIIFSGIAVTLDACNQLGLVSTGSSQKGECFQVRQLKIDQKSAR